MGVNADDLEPFITRSQSNTGARGLNDLDLRPLVVTGDDLLLSIPASVTVAIRMRIIEQMASAGELDHYAFHVASRQFSKVVNEARPALRAEFVPELPISAIPQSKYISHQILLSFDSGKYAHVLYVSDSTSSETMAARIELEELEDPARQKQLTDAVLTLKGVIEAKIESDALHVSYDPLATSGRISSKLFAPAEVPSKPRPQIRKARIQICQHR